MKNFIIIALCFFVTPVYAQTPAGLDIFQGQVGPQGAQAPSKDPSVSITISPFHLVLPIVEITTELKISPKISIAGILGAGRITSKDDFDEEANFKAFELGAQFRYYALGNFKSGLHVGIESTYIHVSGEVDNVEGTGTGLAIGGFIGYKHTFNFGLVLEAQFGYQVYAITANASDDNGNSDSTSDSKGSFLLNLNIGYSF